MYLKKTNSFTPFYSYLVKILLLIVISRILLQFSLNSSTLSSFISSSIIFFILTLFTTYIFLNKKKWILFFGFFFLFKLTISLFHYLTFVDPLYFSRDGSFPESMYFEYHSVFNDAQNLVKDKIDAKNIFYFESDYFQSTHSQIWNLISYILYFVGCNVLTLTPINIFFTLLLSINFILIIQNIKAYTIIKISYFSLFITLFPLFLLSDNFFRDQIALGLISIALTLFFVSDSFLQKISSIFLILIFSYFYRVIYPLLFLIALMYYFYLYEKKTFFLIIPLVIFLVSILSIQGFIFLDIEYIDGYFLLGSFYYIPLKILFGMVGPFPWTQFAKYSSNPAVSYQLSEYLLGIFQLSYITLIFQNIKKVSVPKELFFLTCFGFLISFSGVLTKQMHSTYIGAGVVFTLPWFFSYFSFRSTMYRALLVLLTFIILNLYVVYFIGELGISYLWK